MAINASAAASSMPRTTRVRLVSRTSTPRPAADAAAEWSAPGLGQQDLAEGVEILHALASPEHDRIQGIVGQVDRHAGLLAEPLVHPAQQGAAAGQDDPAVHDVTCEFGRALVQRGLDRVDDHAEWLLDRATDLLTGYHDGFRKAGDKVPAADFGTRFFRRAKR